MPQPHASSPAYHLLAGLYRAIAVDFLAAVLSGTTGQISGPTAPMAAAITVVVLQFSLPEAHQAAAIRRTRDRVAAHLASWLHPVGVCDLYQDPVALRRWTGNGSDELPKLRLVARQARGVSSLSGLWRRARLSVVQRSPTGVGSTSSTASAGASDRSCCSSSAGEH